MCNVHEQIMCLIGKLKYIIYVFPDEKYIMKYDTINIAQKGQK